MMPVTRALHALSVVVGIALNHVAVAGDLNPPAGPVAPTPGPEPRIAINATNTPGDADSTFKITAPGSYYLTANLTGEAGKAGIEITSSDVTIDLMGFELLGVTGTLDGVRTTAPPLTGIEVRNGSIRSWEWSGIELAIFPATGCIIENIRAISNGMVGISVASQSVILGCIAINNSSEGIYATESVIESCVATDNGQSGIVAIDFCTVNSCTANYNGAAGIRASNGCIVTGCTASRNAHGITIPDGPGSILDCAVSFNKNDGIMVEDNCVVVRNACDHNGYMAFDGAGIHVTGIECRIEENSCTQADRGIDVDVGGNIIIRNTCSGNTTNWDIVALNIAFVVSANSGGAITGDSGGVSPGTANPFANFSY